MSKERVADIQAKLLHKVLPVLERHLTDSKDTHAVRSFVAVCYVQTIRRLPLSNFDRCLHRVVNLIVTRGLRSRDLSHREKARKALVRVLSELRPEFLPVVFEEMKSQLVKGFQQHVYLFTVHHLLASLAEAGSLKPGSISHRNIELNIELLLSELFGDLGEEKANAQGNELKLIKESKLRKAIPIFEILAQYVDFRTTFLSLLAPIIKVLDESPSFSKIQQCEDLLSRVSSSLLQNKTVEGAQLLLFLYSITDRGIQMSSKVKINDEKERRDYGASPATEPARRSAAEYKAMNLRVEMYWEKGQQTIGKKKTAEISGRVLAAFGLQCLKKALKRPEIITISAQDEAKSVGPDKRQELKERLDPFVLLILNSFKTYHNPIVVTSLGILTQIIGLGLPSFTDLLGRFLSRIFKLFSQTQA